MNYSVQKVESGGEHIQTDLLIMILLEGEMTVKYLGGKYQMRNQDIILINPGVSYEIEYSHNAMYGAATFSMSLISSVLKSNNTIFYCNSVVDDGHSYQDLRNLMFKLTAEYASKSHQTDCYRDSLLLKLLDTLVENYQLNKINLRSFESDSDYRIREIMQYIMANLSEDISLNELASQMFVSTSTLSRIFKKNTGEYFADYVMQLRVKSASGLLRHSDQNMTQIAMASGFSNSASFNRAFRKIMGVTPSEYREEYRSQRLEEEKREDALRQELIEKGFEQEEHERLTEINLDFKNCKYEKYTKAWNKVINIGPIWDLNKANVQKHTLMLCEQLHFKYVRMWNIFSKNMMIADGKTLNFYNYSNIDLVFDFLVSHGLKPFLDLGRRPDTALHADGDEVFYEEQYIHFWSKENWQNLIDRFFDHIVDRYGMEEVSGWIFELDRDSTHENDDDDQQPSSIQHLYDDENYDFFEAWKFLHKTIKLRIPNAKLGGLGSIIVKDFDYLSDFYKKCILENVKPDYVSFFVFPYDIIKDGMQKSIRQISMNKYNEENQISEIKRLMKKVGMEDTPIYITEWNNTISNRNYLNDSCFRAAYLVKKLANLDSSVKLVGIMCGSDYVSSHMDTVAILNGGIGLLTRDTIRKPAYFAVDFLNQQGDHLLDKGDNYIITYKDSGDIYILCYYHSWFKRNFILQGDVVDLKKYGTVAFEDESPINLDFHLSHLRDHGEYYVKKRTMNAKNGSVLNEWANFQYDNRLTIQDVKYLQGISIPTLTQTKEMITKDDQTLDVQIKLEPHEVTLIHIFCRK